MEGKHGDEHYRKKARNPTFPSLYTPPKTKHAPVSFARFFIPYHEEIFGIFL